MPSLPRPPYRLDLWSAPAAASGTRVAFLADPGGTAVLKVQRTRFLEPGRSQLAFDVLPTHHALSSLTPQQAIVRLTRFVATTPDTFDEIWEEWRVLQRRRRVKREAAPYEIICVPLEDDLLDIDTYREVTEGGLHRWQYSCTARTPQLVLGDVRDRLNVLGYTWIAVGTVDPSTPVSFTLESVATPRAIISALLAQLTAIGVPAEFQFTRFGSTAYRLELVERVAGALAPLIATTDAAAIDLTVDEDAAEQVNTVIPFAEDGSDLQELQVEVEAVDGGTGWVTLRAIGATPATIVLVDDQWNGRRLFRENTGRSFAIVDSSATPMRVQLAVADLASGLAVGERVSFRQLEDFAGTRRAFGTKSVWSPFRVVSTLTGPARINTEDLQGAGVTVHAANQYRDWEVQRSTLVCALPDGAFDHVTGKWAFVSAPSTAPAIGDWIWCPNGAAYVPGTVTNWNAGANEATVEPRYAGQAFTASDATIAGARCYRPAGSPMWITASATAGNQLTVDAFSGGTPATGDVLEPIARCQGERLVEVPHPAAIAASRRRVGTQQVPCTGATNRVTNADFAAWAGASWDPPDGWTIANIVGTVVRSRVTDPLLTRYGGKAWSIDFAIAASAELRSPLIPAHSVPGLTQVAAAVALIFSRFSGTVPLEVRCVAVHASGTRTALPGADGVDVVSIFPPDTTAQVDDSLKPALDAWYDAIFTNLSLAGLADEQLQLVITRPVGASNPACTVVLDAVMLLQREGLPTATEGGVRYVFGSDATPMLSAAQEILRDRASALLRFEGQFVDLYRLDGLRYAPFELTIGRDVDLRIPALALTRTVRLLGSTENLIDPRSAQVVLERVRPDVGRLLAARLFQPVTTDGGSTRGSKVYASVAITRTSTSASQVTLVVSSSCPGRTPPQVRIVALAGGITIASGPSVGTPASSGQAYTINKNAPGSGPGVVHVEAFGSGIITGQASMAIEEQGVELVPLIMRVRILSTTASQVVVRVAVADPLPQGAASATITYQAQDTGTVTPASSQTLAPAATLTEAAGTYVDFTITKPAYNASAGRVTFTVTAANRLAATDAQDVPAATFVAPVLTVDHTSDDVKSYFTWSGGPTVQLKIGRTGSWGAPPASPFTVDRPSYEGGSDIAYNWRTVGGSFELARTDLVLRKPPTPTATPPSFATSGRTEQVAINCTVPGWVVRVNWTITNPNNDDYYIEVRNNADNAVLVTNLACADGNWDHNTNILGDSTGTGSSAAYTYKIQIRKRGTDALQVEAITASISSGAYGPCS